MPVPYLPLHILSMLTVIHTVRGECGLLAERLPHWQKGMSYPGEWQPTPRQIRRWRLLYAYWHDQQSLLLKRAISRQHLTPELARELEQITPLLSPPQGGLPSALPDPRVWAGLLAPFPWREQHGICDPITIRSLAVEARIPAFELINRQSDSAMASVGNRVLMTLGVSLGQALELDEGCQLAVDAGWPEELRLRDEAIGLPLALAVARELSEIARPGLAAAGALDGQGKLLPVQGFDVPYGKLEACFDAGMRELCLPWGTRLYDLPKAGIHLAQQSKGHYTYFFDDDPEDVMQIHWVKDLKGALDRLWESDAGIKQQLRQKLTSSQASAFESWEALAARIDEAYPDWLAIPFRLFFEQFRDMSEQESDKLQDWQDLMGHQARWIHQWLRYVLTLQASGLWLGRQALEELWPAFPSCCHAEASLYLLWQALQQLCQQEQKGPLPFRHMHHWLCQHQTGWGLLINQLLQLANADSVGTIREGLRYNMLRLMELLKSAEFMFAYPLYGVLETGESETLGVQFQGRAAKGHLIGGLPVGPHGLYIEDPRTRTRFQLPFLRICPQCRESEDYAPLTWAGRDEQGLRFAGCAHTPVYFAAESSPGLGGLTSAYGWSTQPWVTAEKRQTDPDTGGEESALACVLHSELLLDAFTTLQDPQQMVATYEKMVHELLGWLKFDPKESRELILSFSGQAIALVFLRRPEAALAFALALHQLVSDYNSRQTMPSAHLQIRTGLDLGLVRLGPGKGKVTGPPLHRSLWLAHLCQPGQMLASEAVRASLGRVSPAHRQIFHHVGNMSEAELQADKVYTISTRTTGLRQVPSALPHKQRAPMLPNQIETMAIVRREPSLIWLSVLGVEIPELGNQSAEVASEWLRQLQQVLYDQARALGRADGDFVFVPYEQGLMVALERPLDSAFRLALALLGQLEAQPRDWQVRTAVYVGLGELRPRHDGTAALRGPARGWIQNLLEHADPGHLLSEGQSKALLEALDGDAEHFKPCVETDLDFALYYYHHQGIGLEREPKRRPLTPEAIAPVLQEAFDGDQPPLAAVLGQAKKLARHRLEDLLARRQTILKEGTLVTGPVRVIQNHLGMLFQHIRPGPFTMGSPTGEPGRIDDETPHLVVLTRPFYMQTTTVNQRQWELLMGSNPSFFRHRDLPVESISYADVQAYIEKLNALGREKYRLPTEAEWEYCCRAGSRQAFCYGNDPAGLEAYAWYQANAAEGYAFRQPHRVATRRPNDWGLYDMHGNVWEWCQDWYDELPQKPVTNPQGPARGEVRVIRGGRWNSSPSSCRSASRSYFEPDRHNPGSLGFRLVMEIGEKPS